MEPGRLLTGNRVRFSINSYFGRYFGACIAFFLLLTTQTELFATHLRAGNITVRRVACNSNDYIITLTVYTNAGSPVLFSDGNSGELNFGDGSKINHPNESKGDPVPGFSKEFNYVIYTVTHTYGNGTYTISYYEQNRNEGILNMDGSVNTAFYIDTVIEIDPSIGCDNSPILQVPPIDKACRGVRWQHNPGAYDIDFDSLSYKLVVPKKAKNTTVDNYRDPNTAGFYGANYNTGNQAKDGPPSFSISTDGTITWDSPGLAGQYNIAFHVIQWRKDVNGIYQQIGFVTRDMQIIVEDCSDRQPVLLLTAPTLCVEAGSIVDQNITATDPDFDPVRIEAFSRLLSLNPNAAVLTPKDAIYQTTSPGNPASLNFHWATLCKDVAEQPYEVVFKATDQPKANTGDVQLVEFATMHIEVVGPAPKWTSVTSQPGHKIKLVWESYVCANTATIMQVWRRVESNPYDPPACVTGMPASLGFTKIAEVPIGTTTYTDTNGGKGLAPGTNYCYRLVASYPEPKGGLSYVSKEQCLTTLIDAPVITNVTIDRTDKVIGEDTIKWQPPLASDATFPPPYTYGVYRAEGFTGNTNLVQLTPGKIDTTFFIDTGRTEDALNTEDKIYNYRILAYSGNSSVAFDTSAVASTVRLELHPGASSIELSWSASVPWSQISSLHPLHYVYRGPEGSKTLSDMSFIGTVDVTQFKETFVDSGQVDHTPLDKSKIYCYCVKTVGGYGNPKIIDPLYNYSQITCAQPNDNTPPCKVTINAKPTDCNAIFAKTCSPAQFSNTLTWKNPTADCLQEAYRYNIYSASQSDGTFTLRATVSDTVFVDTNLSSFARCYKVAAISRSGIEGPLSDAFCFDNCPYYELPNVFTPGNADHCNDLFSAFSERISDDVSVCQTPSDPFTHCARFVDAVTFTVYNRWGKEVYTYQSSDQNSIYIDWDGRDDGGKDVTAGIYYYLAEVSFNVVDPARQKQKIKGWVQILR